LKGRLQVRALTLEDFNVSGNVYKRDLRDAFAALTHMTSLTLIGCPEIDKLLPYVCTAPKLRQLVIQPAPLSSSAPWEWNLCDLLEGDAPELVATTRLIPPTYGAPAPSQQTVAFMRELQLKYSSHPQLNSLGSRFVVDASQIPL
jgi:hypothetical protein